MLKAVVFDIDDTMYRYDMAQTAAMDALMTFTCEQISISVEQFHKAFAVAKAETKLLAKDLASSHSRMVYCQKTLENLGYKPITFALEMYDVFWNTFLAHMEPDSGLIEIMEYFKNRGIKIGVCTDLTTHIQHRKLNCLGVAKYVDAIVTSEEAGAEKPNRKMFDLILNKLKVLPEESWFVGDSLKKDIKGAAAVGMTPFWIGGKKEQCNSYHIISELGELLDYEFENN